MDEAVEINDYLPLSYRSPDEQGYVQFLWDTFETNYQNGKYQFAFLAYHMLAMSFVYFNIWQIKQTEPANFALGLIGFDREIEKAITEASSPFMFSVVRERSILRVLKLIACDNAEIGTYAKLVDDRNLSAHSNGNIFYRTEPALDAKISEVLRVVDGIQSHSAPVIERCYRNFLINSANAGDREYADGVDQVRELLIHANYFSAKDVEVCLAFDLGSLDSHPARDGIRDLAATLESEYGTAASTHS